MGLWGDNHLVLFGIFSLSQILPYFQRTTPIATIDCAVFQEKLWPSLNNETSPGCPSPMLGLEHGRIVTMLIVAEPDWVGRELSAEIGDLQKLRSLQMNNVIITQSAIDSLKYLVNLVVFECISCTFAADASLFKLLNVVSGLKKIVTLGVTSSIHVKAEKSIFPKSLLSLASLRNLVLSDNDMEGVIPEGLGEYLKLLHELRLDGNAFSGMLPKSISLLKRLKVLDVSRNKFAGISSANGTAPSGFLSDINLEVCKLEGNLPSFCLPIGIKIQILCAIPSCLPQNAVPRLARRSSRRELSRSHQSVHNLHSMI